MKYIIKVDNKKQFEVVITLMLASGMTFPSRREGETAMSYADAVHKNYDMPYVDGSGNINATYSTNHISYQWPREAETIISLLFDKVYEMPIGDYTATVTKDGIEVGCQNISFDTFDTLVNLVDEFKKGNS